MARTANTKDVEQNNDLIDKLLSAKKYNGRYVQQRAGDDVKWSEKISTGSFIFDMVLGGGYRPGWSRFMSKTPEAGKTSMGVAWGKQWQDRFPDSGKFIYFNAEGRINKDILDMSGISMDRDRFRIIDTNSGDFIFDFIEDLVINSKTERYFFMIDSMDAIVRDGDSGKGYSDSLKIAGGAVLTSTAGKRLSMHITVRGHHLFLCSQERAKMSPGTMGGGTDASGGHAPKFYSSLSGEIQPMYTSAQFNSYINEDTSNLESKKLGHIQKILLKKTYNQTTGTTVSIPIKYGLVGGVWRAYEAMMMAQTWGFVNPSSSWFNFDEDFYQSAKESGALDSNVTPEKVQGGRKLRDIFDSNPELVEFTLKKVSDLS